MAAVHSAAADPTALCGRCSTLGDVVDPGGTPGEDLPEAQDAQDFLLDAGEFCLEEGAQDSSAAPLWARLVEAATAGAARTGSRQVAAAIAAAAIRVAAEIGDKRNLSCPKCGPEVLQRLEATAPALVALCSGAAAAPEERLRRNVALHAAVLPGPQDPIAAWRRAQKGPRLGPGHGGMEAPAVAQSKAGPERALGRPPPSATKQALGEKLFPQVQRIQPELAGKITGMILEMDNSDLLMLLESKAHLKAKVDEAMHVLQSSGASMNLQPPPGGVAALQPDLPRDKRCAGHF